MVVIGKEEKVLRGEVVTSLGNVCFFENSALLFALLFLIPERLGR